MTEHAVAGSAPATMPAKPAADSGKASSASEGAAQRAAAEGVKGGAGRAEAAAGRSAQAGSAVPGAAGAAGAERADAPESMVEPAADGGGAYTFLKCPDTVAPVERLGGDFPACDGNITCGADAHCIPLDRLQKNVTAKSIERMPDCTGGKCVPDAIVATGRIQFSTCTGDLGEGRCIPQCFALWAEPFSVIFERGAFGCGSQEVCTPCIHPTTGQPSGACQSDMCEAGAAN